jgi:hypothetical protein
MLAIEGMPVGIQIVGQRHADARTAGIARWLFERREAGLGGLRNRCAWPTDLNCFICRSRRRVRPSCSAAD